VLSGNKTSAGQSAVIGVKAKPSPLVGLHTGLDVTRYFIPFSPLVFILFYNNYFQNILKNKEGVKNALATLFLIFSAITTVGAIIQRYYI